MIIILNRRKATKQVNVKLEDFSMDILTFTNCFLNSLSDKYEDIMTKTSKTIITNQIFQNAYHNIATEYIIEDKKLSLAYIYDLCKVLDVCILDWLESGLFYKREEIKIEYVVSNYNDIVYSKNKILKHNSEMLYKINIALNSKDNKADYILSNAGEVTYEELKLVSDFKAAINETYFKEENQSYDEEAYIYYLATVILYFLKENTFNLTEKQYNIIKLAKNTFDNDYEDMLDNLLVNILFDKYENNKVIDAKLKTKLDKHKNMINNLFTNI